MLNASAFVIVGVCVLSLVAVTFGEGAATAPTPDGQAKLYDGPKGIDPSPLYSVSVNGKPAFVYPCSVSTIADAAGNLLPNRHVLSDRAPAAMCYFDFTGKVQVEVTIHGPQTHILPPFVTVRPQRHGIVPVIDGNTFRFEIDRPCQLSIEPLGLITAPLLLFASAPEELPAPAADAPGVMYFGPGVHKMGLLNKLEPNTTIYIAGGAVVRGQIAAEGLSNITVRGRGILDASLSPAGNEPANEWGYTGRHMRWFKCRNLTIDGIILHDSPSWGIELAHCDNVRVNNIKVITSRGADGIDVCSSENVRVQNSFFRTHDDSLNVKGLTDLNFGYPGDGNGHYSPAGTRKAARDIQFTNCVIWNDRAHCMMIGPETRATVIEDVLFKDIDVIHAVSIDVIGLFSSDAAPIHRVRYENIRVEDARVQTLFELRVGPQYTTADANLGPVDDVTIRNLQVNTPTRICSAIYGDQNEIKTVRLENIHIYNKFARTLQDMPVFIRGKVSDYKVTVDANTK